MQPNISDVSLRYELNSGIERVVLGVQKIKTVSDIKWDT